VWYVGRGLEVFLPRFFGQCLGSCGTVNWRVNWIAMTTVEMLVRWMQSSNRLSVHLLSIVEVGESGCPGGRLICDVPKDLSETFVVMGNRGSDATVSRTRDFPTFSLDISSLKQKR
jgi:hypothetical protein